MQKDTPCSVFIRQGDTYGVQRVRWHIKGAKRAMRRPSWNGVLGLGRATALCMMVLGQTLGDTSPAWVTREHGDGLYGHPGQGQDIWRIGYSQSSDHRSSPPHDIYIYTLFLEYKIQTMKKITHHMNRSREKCRTFHSHNPCLRQGPQKVSKYWTKSTGQPTKLRTAKTARQAVNDDMDRQR